MKAQEKKIPAFLNGGGEMGELIRSFDWTKTSIGCPTTWPQSLRTAVRILLDCPFGMYIAWGEDFIQIYNDGYRPILGANKHPQALGISTRISFAEIWPDISPMFEGVMNGTPTRITDYTIELNRNGFLEECVFDFASSSIRLENGEVGGVLTTVIETTETVKATRALKDSEQQLQFAIEAAELGTWDLNPATNKFTGNSRLKEWFGLEPYEEIDLTIALEVISDQDRDKVQAAIQKALQFSSGGYYDITYTIINKKTQEERIVRAKGRASFTDEGIAYRFNGTLQDITEQEIVRRKIEEGEHQMRTMVETAPFPIGVYIGKEMTIQFANQVIIDFWGKGSDVIGKSYKKLLPELDNQGIFKQLDHVYATGIPFHVKNRYVTLNVSGESKSFYFNYSFTPLKNIAGEVYGIMSTAADLTEVTLAKLAIQKSEENLRNTILQAPVAMCIFRGDSFVVELANDRMFELWGKNAEEVMHLPIFEGLPEAKDQGFEEILQGVYATGETFFADGVPITLPRNGVKEVVYVNFVYEPYREPNGKISGILAVAIDVTDQVSASKKIEERERKFRLLADSMPQFVWTGDANGNLTYFNQSVYNYSGKKEEEIKKDGGWLQIVHPDEREENIKQWLLSVNTGTDFKFEHRFQRHDGEYRWQLSRAKPQLDENGNIQMWVGTSTDIQDQKNSTEFLEAEVRERTEELRLQNQTFKMAEEIAKFGSYKWNVSTGSMEYSDNLFRLFDCEPHEFVPSYETFLSFVHPEDLEQIIKNEEATMKSGSLVEAPYRIISKKGKLKYLRSSGGFVGQDKNRMLIGTVQDISKDIEVAEELQEKNLELELTNAELQSFNYIASHDLKEPLRKIQAFSKRIIETEKFSGKTQDYFNRIISAGERMQNLLDSLLDFSRASKTELIFDTCDLNAVVEESKNDLQENIKEKQATIISENLPTVNGIYIQFTQLFTNLIENALKYSRSEVKPHIEIKASLISGNAIEHPSANNKKDYHAITITDNGIGFEDIYTQKIFELFQRLHHKHEYSGTGVGLSIVKKIVTNHNGFITAEGKPNVGSTFTIYLPTT